jgi:hypothetical protein
MNDTGSAIPTPGYDDLTPEAIAREYRGRIHQAEQHLARLEANDGDTAATTDARRGAT